MFLCAAGKMALASPFPYLHDSICILLPLAVLASTQPDVSTGRHSHGSEVGSLGLAVPSGKRHLEGVVQGFHMFIVRGRYWPHQKVEVVLQKHHHLYRLHNPIPKTKQKDKKRTTVQRSIPAGGFELERPPGVQSSCLHGYVFVLLNQPIEPRTHIPTVCWQYFPSWITSMVVSLWLGRG
ncbi:hypothetical protein CDEST_00094 [Colletotrichum destructivum]|uniref:Secreted protein n=1 Tax=Colletotrichum destructivum TaxID=34406 RepID=A0AAX4HVU9_9PEZI|nr:hypothetical protein CDEST_00094 [Colletotrichum destructivum]